MEDTITLFRLDIIQMLESGTTCYIAVCKQDKNHLQLTLVSSSITAKASGKISLLALVDIAISNFPLYFL